MRADVSKVVAAIEDAFRGVTLENGISLREAIVMDNYGTDEERQKARAQDELHDWRTIPDDLIALHSDSLAFLDAKGNLLGHCPDRVGEVMVDCAKCALEQGQEEQAASMCQSVIDDFTRIRLLERCEQESGALLVEDEIALRKLQDAIDLLNKVRGDKNPEWQMLKARCSALLSR